ncbi:MAG: aldehyde dehydrogenase family protein [Syntrophorhabdaceae bacterium]|nr:aldehyde dehydrogenase family protein [Syntrophorhabdaceae bacterium]MDD5243165.1 aldehyde dehydrogenase family protein [Syntrophorhabdaceae bacterium]
MAGSFKNFIKGEWIDAAGGQTFQNINPSDLTDILGSFPDSKKDDVDSAVSAAASSFPAWKDMPPAERANIITKAGRIMEDRKEELARTISRENGKTITSALGDVQSGIDMAYFAAGEGRRLYGKTSHSALRKRFAMTKRYPVGVTGIITSWNFPMAITCWKTFPALLCGNTVVLKSEENTPETAVCFAQALEEAGLPAGVLNVIHGTGPVSGEYLTLHPGVSMISFTGSSAVGRIIGKNCAARLAKASLELGGKNGVIVMDDADIDLAVDGVIVGAFSISGQRCTATGRVIVHKTVYDQFTKRLLDKTSRLRVGPGNDPSSEVTPIINRKQFDRVIGYISRAEKEGAGILIGGEPLTGGVYDKGYYISPAVMDRVTPGMEIAREEVFGPVLAVMKADSYADAIEKHNDCPYGLSASLFTKDVNLAFNFFDDAEAGACYINAPTFGSEPHMPFGGVKHSGLGYREAGWAAIEAFSEVKTLYVDYSATIQNVQFVEEE